MLRNSAVLSMACLVLLAMVAPGAFADEIALVNAPGTVTMTQVDSNTVQFTVQLTEDYLIVGGGTVFAFNFTGDPSQLTVNLPAGYTSCVAGVPGCNSQVDGIGSFEVLIDRDPSQVGKTATLTFTVTRTGGLTVADLLEGSDGNYFAVHVQPPGAESYYVGTVPEPGTLALLGTGLLAVGGALRRRLNK